MKEVLRDILIATVTALAIPAAIYIGVSLMPLKKVMKGGFNLGSRLSAPLLGGARNTSGRIAHWGAGRGFLGRTAARVATGAIGPGGRRQMERVGEAYRKGNTERMVARGMYRIQPSGKMNAELLEKVTPDAISRWVNSDDPNTRKSVEQLRQMVVASSGAIKLSTAQRDALFSGGGMAPLTDTGPLPGMSPVLEPVPPGSVPGGPTTGGLAGIKSARESRGRWGSWLSSNERPTVVPGPRQRGQNIGSWLGGHAASWAGWAGRPVRGGAAPASPAPLTPPPPPPGSPPGTPPGPSPIPPPSPPPRGPGYRP